MKKALPLESLNQLFYESRTCHGWMPEVVSEGMLQHLYNLMKWAPTCVNGAPARIIFVKSNSMKERLIACLMEKNVGKTLAAPVTAILAYDTQWYDHLPRLYPHADYRPLYKESPSLNESTAFRNSSIQGGYFILAARSLGLDVGPMSGFDAEKVNDAFFKGTSLRVNFLCNIGYGDLTKVYDRAPRLDFNEVCWIV